MADQILFNRFAYYLPLTRVRIHGTQTSQTAVGGAVSVTSSVTVDLVASADPLHPRFIEDADSLVADRQLTLEMTERGLLSSTDATSTGRLGGIVTNIFGAVIRFGLFFGGVGALPLTAVRKLGVAVSPEDAEYRARFPALAGARDAAKAAVGALITAIADESAALIPETDPTARAKKREHLLELGKALTAVKAEAKGLEEHFEAWKASAGETLVTPRDYTTAIADLPKEEDVRRLSGQTEAEIRAALPPMLADLFWDLRVVVADAKAWLSPSTSLPPHRGRSALTARDQIEARGVEIRLPRPTVLSLFEIQPVPGSSTRYRAVLKERRDVSVLDDHCATTFLQIKSSVWSNKSLDVDFAPTGAVRKVSTDSKAELAAFAEALAKMPPEVLQAMKDANAFADEGQKLALQQIEQRIEQLKKEKDEAAARIARNETLATEDQAAEVKRLEQEIQLLQKRVSLQALAGTAAGDVQVKVLAIEEDLVKARTALEQAEIERLKVQAELKKLQPPASPPV